MRPNPWLIFLPVALFAVLANPKPAWAEPGLTATGYYINNIPPTRSDDVYPSCGSEIENNINRNFNGEPFQDCGWDYFMVHYEGYIDIPKHTTIEFMVAADDGGTVEIAGQEFGTWNIKGCSWSTPITLSVMPGPQPLDGWFFEAGGGTCYMLAWKIDDEYWEIVPEWAFTTASTPSTTTTTTTVLMETVPVTDPSTTTVQPTTTVVEETTTSTTEESTTTTSTLPPSTSTTQGWAPPPQTTEPAPVVTEPPVEDTVSPVPTEVVEEVPDTAYVEDIPETTEPQVEETVSVTVIPVEEPQDVVETTVPVSEEIQDVVVPEEPSQEQAAALATDPQVLAVVSAEEATQIFEALDVEELTEEQVTELVAAVQNAPEEVREAFEDTINVFGEGFDSYVPLGSNIPVGTRRTLIAVTAGMALAAAGTRMGRQ